MVRLRVAAVFTFVVSGMLGVPGGCHMSFPGPYAGNLGATQGGAQDMGLARELIAGEQVPPAEAFVVEGMFSEHELGLSGGACARTLCLREAAGIAPAADGTPSCWLQVGLSSTIDMETFVRPSVTVVACIDVSGSMGWDYATSQTEYPTPGQVSRNLLSALAGEMTGADRIAIVTYGTTVHTVLPLTPGDEQVTIQARIDALSTGGVTDMEGGLRRAYEIARTAETQTDEVRVMLFTDIQPNVGATTASAFEEIAAGGAAEGTGLSVFGVGVGMRQELLTAISHLRGGNAFSLFDNEDVAELMEDDWPWLVSPIAYNLTLDLTPTNGFTVGNAYGFPKGDGEGPRLETATVFLSKRKGALLVRFEGADGIEPTAFSVSGDMSYDTPEGEPVEEQIDVTLADAAFDETGQYFAQESVRKSVALALLVSGMAEAAERYGEDPEGAIVRLEGAIERFTADAAAMDDAAVAAELALAGDLLALMQAGAPQGDLYGQGYLVY